MSLFKFLSTVRRARESGLLAAMLLPLLAHAQTLDIRESVRTYTGLTNTTVTLGGRAELRITGTGDPIPGCTVDLTSPDAWVIFTGIAPSQVTSTLLSRVRVNGASAVLNSNCRAAQFVNGTAVIPHGDSFAPLEIFAHRHFTGRSRRLNQYVDYDNASLATLTNAIGSFKLKRGYAATFAQNENGTGVSRNFVAQDGDVDLGRLPASLENNVHFIRVYAWRWTTKKGIAGNIESGLNTGWGYNWNLDRNSSADWEYIPIRQLRYWPGLDQDWRTRGSTQLLGYNEPDHTDQANMTVADAISSWPDLLSTGLRVGAPAVSDGGRSGWLYPFIQQADAAGLRVDFVPVHYYWCYDPANPSGAASQMYNFLLDTYNNVGKRPLWITEWNNGANWTGCGDPTSAQQAAAVQAMIDMLESTPFVERYALYNWVEDVRRVKWDDGSLTSAGVNYRNKVSNPAYRQEAPDSGVGSSARYAFDGDARDMWGNGFDGMCVGAPKFTAGKYGQAIAFDGANDYLQISPRVGDSTDWSFSGWVFWNGGGNWQRVFDLGSDDTHYLFLSPRTSGGFLRFAIQNGSGEQQLSGPAVPTNVWTHLAVTISGNTGKLFVNGVAVATNIGMNINPVDVGTKYNYLGKSRFAADALFWGRLDDIRFVSSALTDAQVLAIYNTPPPQFRTTTIYKPDALVGQPYSATLAGEASGIGALTYERLDGPAWLSVAADGALTGTPGATNGGVNSFYVRVTDTNGSLHAATLLINVPTLTVAVSSSADDAEQAASGAVTLTSTDLELINDDAGGAGNQIVGIRFADVAIPRGAIITSATIQFTADEAQSETTTLNIFAEASDNAAIFQNVANNISSRARTVYSVPWQPAAWNAGESNATQRTPNVAGLVQEVTSRAGWSGGNALAFILTGSGHRTADAFDKAGGFPPRFTVNYISPTPVQTLVASVSSGANDAEQAASGAVNIASTDLELVNDGAQGDQLVGLRFENLPLPRNALVTSAAIQFSANEAQSEPTALTIGAQSADNAAAFANVINNISARPLTTSLVAWSPAAWTNVAERGPLQRTPDVSSLVSEVIVRSGWSNGNAIAFVINGTGHRTADAADEIGGLPPTLTVDYTTEIPVGTYARWASTRPNATSRTADPDSDGYNNLFEYTLGLDPNVPNYGATPLILNGSSLELTYVRPVSVTDVSCIVEWADNVDAPTWSSVGVTQQIISDDGTQRVIRAVVPKGASGKRFVRLKVSQ